jgi:ribosomal protein L35
MYGEYCRDCRFPAEFLTVGGKFYYKGSDHKVLLKNKTNLQVKNLRTGKVLHITNFTQVS